MAAYTIRHAEQVERSTRKLEAILAEIDADLPRRRAILARILLEADPRRPKILDCFLAAPKRRARAGS